MRYYTLQEVADILGITTSSVGAAIVSKASPLTATNNPDRRNGKLISEYSLARYKEYKKERIQHYYSRDRVQDLTIKKQ